MRAHPYRFIVHNGEINTIRGNVDKMLAREENMESEYFKYDMHKVLPIINQEVLTQPCWTMPGIYGHEWYGPAAGCYGNHSCSMGT